ncbi:MAG: 50S ribosomal protein L1 [Asgard group archaeon]|nr:50S ribosomal protein L1 [Asgard group archaeon]
MDINKLTEAVAECKKASKKRKFTESIDLAVNFKDLDLKVPSNRFNFQTTLPHPIYKKVTTVIFAGGELAVNAKNAGVKTVLSRTELEALGKSPKEIRKLAKEHDFFLAEPPLMPLIARFLGKYLAPRGKMPQPITPNADIPVMLERFRRTAKLRIKENPVVLAKVGNVKMNNQNVAENIEAIIHALEGKLENGIMNIRSVMIKTTMGKSIKLEVK